jgi:hypothetical protein
LLRVEVALMRMKLGREDPTTTEEEVEKAKWDLHIQIWNAHQIYVPVHLM